MSVTRVSDAEREAVVARLGVAAAEGRLEFAEFEDRAALAYASRTEADLARLVADLPSPRSGVVDLQPWLLPALSVVGGWAWLPLFPGWDWAPATGLAGVALGVAAWRAPRHWPRRLTALVGLAGGVVGVGLMIAFVAIMMHH
jgi:hypothetical protein